MGVEKNVGGLDRVVRGVVGVWLVIVGIGAYTADRRFISIVAIISGAGLLQNALTQYCGFNSMFGIDTSDGGSCARE